MRTYILPLLFLFSFNVIMSQVYSDRVVDEDRIEMLDSIAELPYPYALPIWGKKAIQKGFDIPHSAGVSATYVWQESDIVVNNIRVGFNNGELYNLDDYVRIPEAIARAEGLNVRPDFWIFPFLNVYGLFAKLWTSTEVNAVISLPNQDGFEDVADLNTRVEFEGTTAGFGITPTIGIAGGWFALDFNFTWTDISQLNEPTFTFVVGPRVGKTFHFKNKKSNLAVWVGGFRLDINNKTAGSLEFSEIFQDTDGRLEESIMTGMQRVMEKQAEVDAWFNSLPPPQQALNRPKYEAITSILGRANEFLFRLEDGRQRILDSSVQYAIDKKQRDLWNFIVGAQYQFSKNLMFRAEYGFLGSRKQFIGGIQYRFRL